MTLIDRIRDKSRRAESRPVLPTVHPLAVSDHPGWGRTETGRHLLQPLSLVPRVCKLYQAKHGLDTGLEQQAFQLLEDAGPEVDWSAIEAIEARVAEDVGGRMP